MVHIDHEVNRYLTLLRNRIRERGFTQLEVQEALGWGRSYISQLLTRQKKLRVDQVLSVLNVIGVDPAEFFGELHRAQFGSPAGRRSASSPPVTPEIRQEFEDFRSLLQGLMELLLNKEIFSVEELSATVAKVDKESAAATP